MQTLESDKDGMDEKYDKKLVREFATSNKGKVNHRSKSAKRLNQRELERLKIKCHEI